MITIPAKVYDAIASVERSYKSLPIKLQLFIGMLIAANTAAFAIKFSLLLAIDDVDYFGCLGVFLAYRVFAFMANPSLPLNDKNVEFMSSERTLWNLATLAVLAAMTLIRFLLK